MSVTSIIISFLLLGMTRGTSVINVPRNCDLQTAIERSRVERSKGHPVTINVARGTYSISHPISLTVEDAFDAPLVIKGCGYDKSIISGAVDLPPFRAAENGLWVADLSSLMPSGGNVSQLFVNGQRAVIAQTPNYGEFFVTGTVVEKAALIESQGARYPNGFAYQTVSVSKEAAEALSAEEVNPSSDIMVNFYHAWDMTSRYIESFDPVNSLIAVAGPFMRPWNTIGNCSQFILSNGMSFLDAEGEYFYDKDERLLYYKPRNGESLSDAKACISSPESLLLINGAEDRHVRNVSFEDIGFEFTGWRMERRGVEPQQAAASIDAVVMLDYATGVSFDNCCIAHSGNAGIWFRKACLDCSITHSYIHDIGAGAVKIGSMSIPDDEDLLLTKKITVDNNIIREGGRLHPCGVGVTLFHASDCNITHNEVADFYYSGMSIGWVWGYAHSPSKRNKVMYNHIHHIGWGFLSDMGGVYTLGKSEGTEVSHNVIHDIYSFGYGGWGLYTDEGSSDIKMEYNLVYRCKSSGFHQHYGRDNLIRNNIFINNLVAQFEATRVEDHNSFSFTNNIVVYDSGRMLGNRWAEVKSVTDNNLYWNPNSAVSFNGMSIEDWRREIGKDIHSVIADPGFKDPSSDDWRISESPALSQIGFELFDWSDAGVYGDEEWHGLAKFDPARAALYDDTVNRYLGRTQSGN